MSEKGDLQRVHVMLPREDWERLGLLYGSSLKRGAVVRALVRRHLRWLAERAGEGGSLGLEEE